MENSILYGFCWLYFQVYMKFLDAVVENLERRFPDIPLLEAFAAFNVQQWPEHEAELQMFGCDSIQVKEKNCV